MRIWSSQHAPSSFTTLAITQTDGTTRRIFTVVGQRLSPAGAPQHAALACFTEAREAEAFKVRASGQLKRDQVAA